MYWHIKEGEGQPESVARPAGSDLVTCDASLKRLLFASNAASGRDEVIIKRTSRVVATGFHPGKRGAPSYGRNTERLNVGSM
ncbi:hypothetical protein [uncultured Stenotrophomonas sp.]|uniref:hypothetical protein n=1 Tax=uncultured Stenotrophomonas sp. TaxID=165438 RepID=UPI0025D2DF3A|nr:hypothetical protein [uncultured Stenotrophomonas sp.]